MEKKLTEREILNLSEEEKSEYFRKTFEEAEIYLKTKKEKEPPEYISVYVVDKGKSGYFAKVKNTYEDICEFLGAKDWDCFCEYFDCLNIDDEDDDSDYEGTLHCIADSTRNFELFFVGNNLDNLKQLRRRLKGRFIFIAGEDMNEFYEEIGEYYSKKLREQFEF